MGTRPVSALRFNGHLLMWKGASPLGLSARAGALLKGDESGAAPGARCVALTPRPICSAGKMTTGGQYMATKDKNTKKSMEKKPAQKTLKEKRQAKKAKR